MFSKVKVAINLLVFKLKIQTCYKCNIAAIKSCCRKSCYKSYYRKSIKYFKYVGVKVAIILPIKEE